LDAARGHDVDCILLAGDVFDHNSVDKATLARTRRVLDSAPCPIVILPGNHDALVAGSVYERMPDGSPAKVAVLGLSSPDSVMFESLDLEVVGEPHRGFDYPPLRLAARARTTRYQVFMAHGQLLREERDRRRSWVFTLDEIRACTADYVALGHWDTQMRLSEDVPAYYSGSPRSAGSALLVTLGAGEPRVLPVPVR
jgi:DNA repair exonuclease SbcCD nuclease subunit